MNHKYGKKIWSRRAAHGLHRELLAALVLLAASGIGFAQDQRQDKKTDTTSHLAPAPTAPATITPPPGNAPFLSGHAVGTQGYICMPTANGGVSWTVNPARPEATLFTKVSDKDVQIITHFQSPVVNPNGTGPNPPRFGEATWQSSLDSSRVWAQKLRSIQAGSDRTCPNTGSIDCLLLQVIGSDEGPAGGKLLTKTTFIQRLNTKGGSAPTDSCLNPSEIGRQILVPYSADYFFFRSEQ